MTEEKKIRRAIRYYPFYEAAAGDLLFYSVIETLFLTLVKGLSVQQIAMVFLITDLADLLLEYPSYRIIRRIGNSRSIVIGGMMPLIGIITLTAGRTIPVITAGNFFFMGAGNFQSMAGAGARNNLVLAGEKDRYAALFSRANLLYAAANMIAATLMPFAFSYNRYLPSMICILVYTAVAASAFLIPDYSEDRDALPAEGKSGNAAGKARIGKGLLLLLAVFSGFFCAGSVFGSNTQLFISGRLGELVSERGEILVFGGIIWLSRVVRLGANAVLSRILAVLKERIVVLSCVTLFAAFLMIGLTGILFPKTWIPVIAAGVFYVTVKGVLWDPLRTYLRMTAADTNSKRQQQTTLVALNAGQSVTKILMDLIVAGMLRVFPFEYVFLALAAVAAVIVLLAFLLKKEMESSLELMRVEATLEPEEIDRISAALFEHLRDAGTELKEAVSYRLLCEEKLLNCLNDGKAGEPFTVVTTRRLNGLFVEVGIGQEKMDLFEIPLEGDAISKDIFFHIIRSI